MRIPDFFDRGFTVNLHGGVDVRFRVDFPGHATCGANESESCVTSGASAQGPDVWAEVALAEGLYLVLLQLHNYSGERIPYLVSL